MIPSSDYPTLKYFIECYFHQNWIDFHATYEEVMDSFVSEEIPELVARLKVDVDRILALPVDAGALSEFIDRISGGGYDPDGMDGRSFLELLRDRLARTQS
jgi:CdiI immunity protein